MKAMKKMLAVLVSVMMALGMMTTAFAAENVTITFPTDSTHTYEVYQIFTGDLATENGTKILSNIVWGENGTGNKGEKVDKDVLTALEAVKDAEGNPAKLAVIEQYVELTNPVATLTGTNTTYTGAPGYYLIKDKDGTVTGDDSYTTYIVQVLGNTTIAPKGSVPTVDKEIVDGDDDEADDASIGDTISYKITGTMPENIAEYKTYFYKFTDTLSKGLTYDEDSLEVKIGDVNVTNYFYVNASEYDEATGTTITVSIADIKALDVLENVTIDADTEVVVTYTATLNENALIAGSSNPNDVDLEYSNDPNNSGEPFDGDEPDEPGDNEPTTTHPTGTTPKDVVKTYTTQLTVTKTDGTNTLTGAEFTLEGDAVNVVKVTGDAYVEDEDGTYWKLADGTYTTTAPIDDAFDEETGDQTVKNNHADYASVDTKYSKETTTVLKTQENNVKASCFVNDKGKVIFTGLGEGTYTLSETVTPAGYNTIKDVEFEIVFNEETETFSVENVTEGFAINLGENADNTLYTEIVNQKGTTLPETGGMGTTLFYAVGGLMVVAAGVLLITKKRMNG